MARTGRPSDDTLLCPTWSPLIDAYPSRRSVHVPSDRGHADLTNANVVLLVDVDMDTYAQGLRGWQSPSAGSARALQSAVGAELNFGTARIPVIAVLLPAAKTLSVQLVISVRALHP